MKTIPSLILAIIFLILGLALAVFGSIPRYNTLALYIILSLVSAYSITGIALFFYWKVWKNTHDIIDYLGLLFLCILCWPIGF